MRCSRPARSSSRSQEPQPDIQRIAFGFRTLEASLPGRGPGHSVDGVAPSFRQSASSTLKALPATPNMRRPMPTAETTMHPAGTHSGGWRLTREKRLDNRIGFDGPRCGIESRGERLLRAGRDATLRLPKARSATPPQFQVEPSRSLSSAHSRGSYGYGVATGLGSSKRSTNLRNRARSPVTCTPTASGSTSP